ncbi:cytochrome-c peroxidase [Hymenobacter sp. CRA2]|uniref:cytochrome-c peroxidase n=1 Tax=Hymenobacter sp. CRA2 TaxID=1955620 RepID=UPI00158FED44|nr:cytochrome c peroxidase [Hymenobacter sp. CRA2]
MPADNPLTEEGVALGRRLFYEKQLSADGTISCASCHQQSKAFTDGRAFAIGVNGQQHRRSSMSLVNLAWDKSFTWDGATNSLETQARVPLENPVEMHQSLATSASKLQQLGNYPQLFGKAFGSSQITEDNILKALAQFERTLVSYNSKYDRSKRGEVRLTADEQAGLDLFSTHSGPGINGAECFHCHSLPSVSGIHEFTNNGVDVAPFADPGRGGVTGQAFEVGRFKIPNLRNVALTAPYMHDGRFQTLEEVIDHYSDHVKSAPTTDGILFSNPNNFPSGRILLNADQKRQILAFLHTLTDTSFLTDPRYSDPNP